MLLLRLAIVPLLALFPASLALAEESPAAADEEAGALLEVVVHGTGGGGIVNWALYADEEQHDSDAQMRGGRTDSTGDSTTVSMGSVEPGRYSVAVFLDEDGDGEFDTNFLGIPREPFGFSNDAMGAMGKPSFDAASFEVGTGGASVELTLKEL